MSCKNSNGEWYIIDKKVKVEINDAAMLSVKVYDY